MNDDLTLAKALDRDPEWRTTAENLMADEIERLRNALGLIATARIPANARNEAGIAALQDLARMALNGDDR